MKSWRGGEGGGVAHICSKMPVLHSTEELARLRGHRWQISCLEFSPDGSKLASGGWDKEVRVWDLGSLDTSAVMKQVHDVPVTTVSWYRPDGALLATGSADSTVALWNAETGENLAVMREHFGWVLGSSFSLDGRFLATSSYDKTVRLWDPSSGMLLNTLNAHTKGVWSVDFYPVGSSTLLCSGSEDATVRIWDARTSKPVNCYRGGHKDAIFCVCWSSDGAYIASGSSDTKIAIWDARNGQVVNFIHGHKDTVKSISFNRQTTEVQEPILASAGDFTVRLSDPRPDQKTYIMHLSPHAAGKEVEAVDISPDGTLLASGGRDGVVVLTTLLTPTLSSQSYSEGAYDHSPSKVNSSHHQGGSTSQIHPEAEREEMGDEIILRTGSIVNKQAHQRHSLLRRRGKSDPKVGPKQGERASTKQTQSGRRQETELKVPALLAPTRVSPEDYAKRGEVALTVPTKMESMSSASSSQSEGLSSTSPSPAPLPDFDYNMDRPVSVASDHFFGAVIEPAAIDIWKTGAQYVLQPDSEDDMDDDDEPVSEI